MKKISFVKKVLCFFGAALSFGTLSAQNRKVEVWDFGGVSEKNAVNHISVSDIDNLAEIASDGKFTKSEITFGDVTIYPDNNDRAYYSGKKNYGNQGYAAFSFDDGYEANGIWYCNGKGDESKRCILIKNVKSGDIINLYARTSNAADEKIYFASTDDSGAKDGRQLEEASLKNESVLYSWIASYDGVYKIFPGKTAGKPVYYRVSRFPAAQVSGNFAGAASGASLKFVVKDTNQEIAAKVSGKNYSANLPAGYELTAVLSGMKGFGVSSDTKILKTSKSDSGKNVKFNVAVAESKTYKLTGKLSGIASDYRFEKLALEFVPPENSNYQPVEIEIEPDFSFAGELEPAVKYTASLKGANDYEISSDKIFDSLSNLEKNVEVKAKPVYEVSGKQFGDVSVFPSEISFKNLEDGYVYPAKLIAKEYSASLRDGKYLVISETDTTISENHVVVNGANVKKDIKYKKKESLPVVHPLRQNLKVGKKDEFKTVNAALKAAAAMNPKSEKERITIHIEPGVYREQIFVDSPYITLKNDDISKEVKLTWYYGIGYYYYSASENGYFDEDLAYDKFAKHIAAKWGVATYVKPTATAFRAEGITFETSFNKYVTDEEIEDGVEMDGSFPFLRKLNSDVRSKAATERSAAIAVEAKDSEFKNCRFLGSQDTLYTAAVNAYFKNCYIEGNTDFIFGDGDVVFENCEIRFAGYTDRASGGYATAARTSTSKGYLFYNCVLSQETGTEQTVCFLGRPWGKDARVAWINTVLGNEYIIADDGWTSMSGNKPENANFREFNTIWNGKPLDLRDRIGKTALKSDSGFSPKDFFGSWKPAFYSSPAKAKIKAKKASFTTDDDINTPYPGHTITVHYSLGKISEDEDESLIQWYRVENVKKDAKETLVKQSAGYADKSYLLTKEDSGFIIKCVVTPKLRSGETGNAISAKLDRAVLEGYAYPSKAAAARPRTADATNIFLAGDSTVKDYSANGMWSAGQTRNEGAWGEFLQNWFNNGVAVQNYANGGRSARNFINEGSLDKIAENIGKGDYLFIQFGHNDCSNSAGYLEDRYVPLGKPDAKGIYPASEGKKVKTPDSYKSKYGDTFYSYDCGGTYKWYLKQYIEAARKAGATPVLVTPVSRLYFEADGKIRPHHDSTDTTTKTQVTSNNAYVEAVRQLAKEENVALIDGFEITKSLYEKAYADKGDDSAARELMAQGESTHNNKLGGFVIAGEFASAIKTSIPALGKNIAKPAKAIGENNDGEIMFKVDSESRFSCKSDYWTKYEQSVIDAIAK